MNTSEQQPLTIPVTEASQAHKEISCARPVIQERTEWYARLSAGYYSPMGEYWANIEAEGDEDAPTFYIHVGTHDQRRLDDVRAMQTDGFPTMDAAIRQAAVLLGKLIQQDMDNLQEALDELPRVEKELAGTIEYRRHH